MMQKKPVLLITGAAKRIGAAVARYFHQHQYNIVLSYQFSEELAHELTNELNQQRANSAIALPLDLQNTATLDSFVQQAVSCFGHINVLVNNASSFYPTPVSSATLAQWDELMNCNSKAAFFLTQALAPELIKQHGCVINLVDIYAEKPLLNHGIYSISKAAMAMLTHSLALELAPDIRVNGISPGAILWPENGDTQSQQALLEKIPLKQLGDVKDIARTAYFLAKSQYITGQIIAVDGGRSLNM